MGEQSTMSQEEASSGQSTQCQETPEHRPTFLVRKTFFRPERLLSCSYPSWLGHWAGDSSSMVTG